MFDLTRREIQTVLTGRFSNRLSVLAEALKDLSAASDKQAVQPVREKIENVALDLRSLCELLRELEC